MSPAIEADVEFFQSLKSSYLAYGFMLDAEAEGAEFFNRVLFAAVRLTGADGASLNWFVQAENAADVAVFKESSLNAAQKAALQVSQPSSGQDEQGEAFILFNGVESFKRFQEKTNDWIRSTHSTPLRSKERVYGVIHVYRLTEEASRAAVDIDLLSTFSSTLALILENKRTQSLLGRENEALRLMADDRGDSDLEENPQKILRGALDRAQILTRLETGIAFLENSHSGLFEVVHSQGVAAAALQVLTENPVTRSNSGPLLRLIQQGGLHPKDLLANPGLNACFADKSESFACLPLVNGSQLLGMLLLGGSEKKSEGTLELLQNIGPLMADQAARAIRNHLLLRSLGQKSRDLESASASLLHAEKLATVGQLAASVAHQIRNPLSVISANVELLVSEMDEGHPYRQTMDLLYRKVSEANATIQELLELSRPVSLSLKLCELALSIGIVEKFIAAKCKQQGVTLHVELADGLPGLWLDENQFQRCLLDLALNALHLMGQGGQLFVRAFEKSENVILQVVDDGPGFKPRDIPHIFDPFFSGKRNGSGLGLFNVRRICNEMGIEATAANGEDGGSVFTLCMTPSPQAPSPIIPKPLSSL